MSKRGSTGGSKLYDVLGLHRDMPVKKVIPPLKSQSLFNNKQSLATHASTMSMMKTSITSSFDGFGTSGREHLPLMGLSCDYKIEDKGSS